MAFFDLARFLKGKRKLSKRAENSFSATSVSGDGIVRCCTLEGFSQGCDWKSVMAAQENCDERNRSRLARWADIFENRNKPRRGLVLKSRSSRQTWTKKIQATTAGPICLQVTTLGPFAGPANANEDCLYLNVYTPNVDPSAKERLPVIVWIHGGGNVDGGSTDYDGSKLASQGHTVVVTINYRLGLLGFMANPRNRRRRTPIRELWNYGSAARP